MKTKKIIALMLSLAMVLGVAAACTNDDGGETTAASNGTQAPAATEAPAASEDADESVAATDVVAQTSAYTELAIADVTDEGDKVLLYGWNDEFPGLVTNYSSVAYDQEITESNTYQTKLDQVLASGEDAPDIFVTDAEWTKKYINSENTLAVNDLGIAYSELSDMYNYTLQVAADDNNVIKGLCWQATPCGIFYNKTVAQETLGVSEPEDVAPFFASWDAVIETARTVNEASNGEKKIVSVSSRIIHVMRRLWHGRTVTYGELFEASGGKSELVATFLAVLELVKGKRVRIDGDGNDAKVYMIEKGAGEDKS